jgi:hypothetical protein
MPSQWLIRVIQALLVVSATVAVSSCGDNPAQPDKTIPVARIVDLRIDSSSSGAAYLSWTTPGTAAGIGAAASYELRWATSPRTIRSWTEAEQIVNVPDPAASGSRETLSVHDRRITSRPRYYFAIRCHDSAGVGLEISNIACVGDSLFRGSFPDTSLAAWIRSRLGDPVGGVFYSELHIIPHLEISQRGVSDLRGISNLSELRYLFLSNNLISDVSPLSDLSLLEYLRLDRNNIDDIESLAGLVKLEYLNLSYNRVSCVSALVGLRELEHLNLHRNQNSDVDPLAGLRNLTYLRLNHNQISDLTFLSGLTDLRSLYLSGNVITDIPPLAGLTSLATLDLSYNPVGDISLLTANTRLTALYLNGCDISDISFLADLVQLRLLGLSNNQIADITPLALLENLEILYLSHNQIEDISPLADLINLDYLSLYDNQISDILPLVQNAGLRSEYRPPDQGGPDYDRVSLWGNPLSEKSINEYIPALRARGVIVYY